MDLMHQLGVPAGDNDRYGLTECVETGNGSWEKGSTYVLSQDRSRKTLAEVGWDETRGTEKKVVWLAAFDAEKHSL